MVPECRNVARLRRIMDPWEGMGHFLWEEAVHMFHADQWDWFSKKAHDQNRSFTFWTRKHRGNAEQTRPININSRWTFDFLRSPKKESEFWFIHWLLDMCRFLLSGYTFKRSRECYLQIMDVSINFIKQWWENIPLLSCKELVVSSG